jgi:hypothetical protein
MAKAKITRQIASVNASRLRVPPFRHDEAAYGMISTHDDKPASKRDEKDDDVDAPRCAVATPLG